MIMDETSSVLQPSVLEPSANISLAGPWSRYFARQLDLALLLIVASCVIILFLVYFQPDWFLKINAINSNLLCLLFLPFAVFLNACIISIFGNSLGKALFGIKALPIQAGKSFSFLENVRREFSVWANGILLGIPVINFFTMIPAFWRVNKGKPTSYDRDKAQVVAYSSSLLRRVVGIIISIAVLLIVLIVNGIIGQEQRKAFHSWQWTNPETAQTITIPAGWTHQQDTGAEGETRYGFISMKTGLAVVMSRIAIPELSLQEYTNTLTESMSGEVTLNGWQPADIANVQVASGVSGEDKYPITIYMAQKDSDFWGVIVLDSLHSGDQEVAETDIVRTLFSSVGIN